MKKQEVLQPALNPEAIYEKSKIYVQRALKAHAEGDIDQYQLWASLALELLGKSRLSEIHPSLVVDPTHSSSLFAASGINLSTDIKTITWKTLFERLQKISPRFDSNVKKFCDGMSQRRNAELHSGEVPFRPMKIDSWEGRYWQVTQYILEAMDMTLEEWLGANESKAPKELIEHARKAAYKAAQIELSDAQERFSLLPKKERDRRLAITEGKYSFHFPRIFSLDSDQVWDVTCPACGAKAFMAGMQYEELVVDDYYPKTTWGFEDFEDVEKCYLGEEFCCLSCDLSLNSNEKIEAIGLPTDYREIEAREREFELDYANE